MIDDEPVGTLDGLSVTEYVRSRFRPKPRYRLRRRPTRNSRKPQTGPEDLLRDRDVTQAIVGRASRGRVPGARRSAADSNTLLRHFNSETAGDTPIERLDASRRRVDAGDHHRVGYPLRRGLRRGPGRRAQPGRQRRCRRASRRDTRRRAALRTSIPTAIGSKLHLLSFHAYRGLYDAERTAHELALGDAGVLIGCERSADVPEPLRRICRSRASRSPGSTAVASSGSSSASSTPSQRRAGTLRAPTGPATSCLRTSTHRGG